MKDDFSVELIARYPLTLGQLTYGCECGPGWRDLLDDLCKVIEPMLGAMPAHKRPCAVQVKEKFGGLRFYMSASVEEIERAIAVAEARAITTCESCGDPGQVTTVGNSWIRVQCPACAARCPLCRKVLPQHDAACPRVGP